MIDQELKDLVAGLAEDRKEVWRLMEEVGRKMKETDRQMKETARRQEETARQMKETDRRHGEIDRQLKKLGALVGGISNNNGYYSETFFQDVFEERLKFGGVKYDKMIPNFGRNDEEKDKKIEIDIVMINCNSVALIETKYRIHPDFVKEFTTKRVKRFRELYPRYNNYKVYLGIAGFSFDEEVLKKAKEYGVGIVKPAGDEDDVEEIEAGCLKAY